MLACWFCKVRFKQLPTHLFRAHDIDLADLRAVYPTRFAEWFWTRIAVCEQHECWSWKGARHKDGRGMLRIGGVLFKAPRIAFEIATGLQAGPAIMHKCDNPPCCNPAHLVSGSQADNVKDAVAKGRTARGSAIPCSTLFEEDVAYIKQKLAVGMSRVKLAREMHVSTGVIERIFRGETWRHVPGPPPKRIWHNVDHGAIVAAYEAGNSPQQIATSLGTHDPSYVYRVLKKAGYRFS